MTVSVKGAGFATLDRNSDGSGFTPRSLRCQDMILTINPEK